MGHRAEIMCHRAHNQTIYDRNKTMMCERHGFLVFFFRYGKNYPMSSLDMSFRPSSVRPPCEVITLERGSNRSTEPIELKIGLDMGN